MVDPKEQEPFGRYRREGKHAAHVDVMPHLPKTSPSQQPNGGLIRRLSLNLTGNGQLNGTADRRSSVSSMPAKANEKAIPNGNGKQESEYERQLREAQNPSGQQTDVLEVWFMGCHADVGGGAVPNEEAHFPCRWV